MALFASASIAPVTTEARPFVYVANRDADSVSVLDPRTNTVVINVPVGSANQLAGGSDGIRMYVTEFKFAAVVGVDTRSNQVVVAFDVGAEPSGIAVTHRGDRAYVANRGDNTISFLDLAACVSTSTACASAATIAVGSEPLGVAITPADDAVYVSLQNGASVWIIDAADHHVRAKVAVGTGPRGIAFAPDGARAYVANHGSGTLSVLDTAALSVVDTITLGGGPIAVAVAPDGRIYVSNDVGTLQAIDPKSKEIVAVAIGANTDPQGLALLPDGSRVYVTNNAPDTVAVIDTARNVVASTVRVESGPRGVAVVDVPQPTATPTATATPTVTDTPTPTPTSTLGPCVGDCDHNGSVTVDELVRGVNIALGDAALDDCPAFDHDGSKVVTVDELVLAVNAALNECVGED
ncbi:MAG: YncE family protein [Deltaproteobacteria bacterium]|nr:YncE family protein [Deltaproteobacteria bacterium]MBI3387834.1 YncE family protein [Deltaproteobacteria bacterium]